MILNYHKIIEYHIIDMKCQKNVKKSMIVLLFSIIYLYIMGIIYPFISLITTIVIIQFSILEIIVFFCYKYNTQLLQLTQTPTLCNTEINKYMNIFTLSIIKQAKILHKSILYVYWLKHIITEAYMASPHLFKGQKVI